MNIPELQELFDKAFPKGALVQLGEAPTGNCPRVVVRGVSDKATLQLWMVDLNDQPVLVEVPVPADVSSPWKTTSDAGELKITAGWEMDEQLRKDYLEGGWFDVDSE